MSTYNPLGGSRYVENITLKRGRLRMEEVSRMSYNGTAFVESWGQGPTEDTVSSVRISGIGSGSIGKELRVKVVARDGERGLYALSWNIERQ